ncbi:MAG: acetate--CoA ligase family protein [Promethearchaeota archaeon]
MTEIDFFFEPKSIAIIGASDTLRFGFTTTKYLLNSKFKTFPVHLYKKEILGHKAYKNIKDIPEDIELAILLVPNERVLQTIKDCAEKGVKGIIIETAGFAETGENKYINIQNEILKIAKEKNIRIIGPNCVGLTNFNNEFSSAEVDFNNVVKGKISVIAQSGVLGNVFIDWAAGQKIGFSKAITLGNKIDIDEIDMLDYLNADHDTNVITLYLEGTKRGNEFKQILKQMRKPVLILKNGRSESGSNAIKSHTASIAGNDKIYNAIIKQNPGVFRVNNFYEMFNIAQVFSTQPLPKGKNVAIITGSGSLGILACDEIEKQTLSLAKLNEETINKIKAAIPKWVSIKGTIDLGPSMATSFIPSLKAILNDNNVDSLLFIFCIPRGPLQQFKQLSIIIESYFRLMKKLLTKVNKPCICVCFGSRWVFDFVLKNASKFDIPVMSRIKHAIKALKMMYQYAQHLKNNKN